MSDWRTDAACLAVDPELFFPTAEEGPAYRRQVATAKSVCRRCPVRAECLAEAVERLPYGIAGGLTPEERRAGTARRGSRRLRDAGLARATRRGDAEVAGRRLLAQGVLPREVARQCDVSERTVKRWITRAAAAQTAPPTEEGAAAATATPSSPDIDALLRTRITEGAEV